MYSYDEAREVLADLIDELPDEIFRELNGGVMLMENAKISDDGTYTMGTYFRDIMGRHVEIYYGSFAELYGDMENGEFRDRLKNTLHHELTHHVENLAGDRSLERWDERHMELCGFGGIDVHSILFVDDDCAALAPAAAALFDGSKRGNAAEVTADFASAGTVAWRLNEKAVKVCASMGADISRTQMKEVGRELIDANDVVLCMTAAQAELLADKYPDLEEKIMCLGEEDVEPPTFAIGWKNCLLYLADEVLAVIDELNLEV